MAKRKRREEEGRKGRRGKGRGRRKGREGRKEGRKELCYEYIRCLYKEKLGTGVQEFSGGLSQHFSKTEIIPVLKATKII
jgi:hypothetical protein